MTTSNIILHYSRRCLTKPDITVTAPENIDDSRPVVPVYSSDIYFYYYSSSYYYYYWAESFLQLKRFRLFLHIYPQRGLSVWHIRAPA